jgi:hypothetical protein
MPRPLLHQVLRDHSQIHVRFVFQWQSYGFVVTLLPCRSPHASGEDEIKKTLDLSDSLLFMAARIFISPLEVGRSAHHIDARYIVPR